jgi:hypothetical protein
MKITITKIYKFLIQSFFYDPTVYFYSMASYFFGTKPTPVKIISPEDLVKAISHGKSLIRFGDGEALLMTGRDIYYHPTSRKLNRVFRQIIASYNEQVSFVLCLPTVELAETSTSLKARGRYRIWRLFRVFFPLRMRTDYAYGDYVTFYRGQAFEKVLSPYIKDKHLICVANTKTLDNTLQELLTKKSKQTSFVFAPSHNAYQGEEKIKADINLALRKTKPNTKPLILLAIGPASKALAFEYCQQDIQSLDIGHGMEIIGRSFDYSDKI